MPIFMDRHDMSGLTPEDVAKAHQMDMEIQGEYGVNFITYWHDHDRETGFCLVEAPDAQTAAHVHEIAHGNLALDIIPVEMSAVQAFLGRIDEPARLSTEGESARDGAFRAVMFTDIVGSTAMTQRLGDAHSVELVRAHDAIVRRSLKDEQGREVKHTGDGIMACFDDAVAAVRSAKSIQLALAAFNLASREPLNLRIGIDAGEPVAESNDLFGGTVQMAARLCAAAEQDSIYVSQAVGDLVKAAVEIVGRGAKELKGFSNPVEVFEVVWA